MNNKQDIGDLEATRAGVREYYGKQLGSSDDLLTDACCDASAVPDFLKPVLGNIHPEVLARYYGCGLVAPALLQACRILDLGCGTGRDVYSLAQLAGAQGHVCGVDMTAEQLAIARQYQDWHAEKFGFANTSFLQGYIENLDELPLDAGSFDVIVSNCVINLSADKEAVLQGINRLLKTGGEFYFSDVYADRRVPDALRSDPVIHGECLGGALYWQDFLALAKGCGFADPRLVEDRPLGINSPQINAAVGPIRFHSATWRLFKLEGLEPACEDYGQAVIYRGSIPDHPDHLVLDKHHDMVCGKVFPVCGNTWRMLADTRFRDHFTFIGDFSRHYGIFEGCGTSMPFSINADSENNGSSCC